MLTIEKAKKIAEKLANNQSLTIVVDQLKIRKRKNVVKIEGLIEADKEYIAQAIQFCLPHLILK